jgi:hypothetical protein
MYPVPMAKPRSTDPIEPMDLANMRANGVRSLDVQCNHCRHRVIVNVDHLPGDLTVPSFRPRMVCTKSGAIGAKVRPNLAGEWAIGRPKSGLFGLRPPLSVSVLLLDDRKIHCPIFAAGDSMSTPG